MGVLHRRSLACRLDFLPDALFKLPSLMVLDVSNNKLHHIPRELWTAPKLKDINISFNLLTDLPNYLTQPSFDTSSSGGELSASPTVSEQSSVSFSDDDSMDDARMMRSIQLATINITPQELTHHRYAPHGNPLLMTCFINFYSTVFTACGVVISTSVIHSPRTWTMPASRAHNSFI